MGSWKSVLRAGLLFAGLAILVAACGGDGGGEDDGGDDTGSSANSVVGTWNVHFQPGDSGVYWVFDADGNFVQYDDAALQDRHLGGTYTQEGSTFAGPCTNPGVGECDIDGTISDDGQAVEIDFIEHWHSPSKHVPLSGTRVP